MRALGKPLLLEGEACECTQSMGPTHQNALWVRGVWEGE